MSKLVIKSGRSVIYFTDKSYPHGYGFLTYCHMTESYLDSGGFHTNHHIDNVLADPKYKELEDE